jgi:hypothetical protein
VIRFHQKPHFVANALLALLLLTAQTAALAHAYQHELGTPQNQACTACVTAGQLASACVDNNQYVETAPLRSPQNQRITGALCSIDAIVVRQRGPPATL